MVLSEGESSGTVTSPNYPRNYPVNVSCHYYIDGLVDRQNLEKVQLVFDDFDLPTVPEGSVCYAWWCPVSMRLFPVKLSLF